MWTPTLFFLLSLSVNYETFAASVMRSGKIVGGYSADIYQFPYQASLRTSLMSTHFCGAFLLTERWLMSAGHCTDKRKPSGVVVVVGAFTRAKDAGVRHNVLLLATHPEFDSKSLQNDISMIKTETFIDFTITVRPVRLQAMPVESDMEAFVSGWGYTDSSGTNPDVLQWIKVRTIDLDECRDKMSRQNAERIFETNICADAMESTGGACMGDSGGPLVTVDGALIAIVSWGVPCGKGLPDVYTSVASFKSWIDATIDFPEVEEDYVGDDDYTPLEDDDDSFHDPKFMKDFDLIA